MNVTIDGDVISVSLSDEDILKMERDILAQWRLNHAAKHSWYRDDCGICTLLRTYTDDEIIKWRQGANHEHSSSSPTL